MQQVFINGKFLTRTLTGVQRTAYEMVFALDELISQGAINKDECSFILIYSGNIVNPIQLNHITLLKKGLFTGNIWEQIELPIYTAGSLLLSMCSISTIFKKNQLLIVHDASFIVNKHFFSTRFRLWYNFAIPRIARICRQIITVSDFSKDELVKYAGINETKITVIYNAANHITRFGNAATQYQEKINALKPYCLAVSSLGANKNFAGLAKAIRQINFANYHMLIAGGQISALAGSDQDDSAIYLGYVSDNELKYLYSNASLFVFPSFYEGFGIPPLEAMLLKCPVIASNTSSLPEVLGDACEYLDPYDPYDMAAKIDSLLHNNAKLLELQDKGYRHAITYNWIKSATELYQLIRQYSD
jgi:glycosyltransferase involved in cell wall biosynthesis